MDWDKLDLDEIARTREGRLRRQVRFQLYAFSPFYRRSLEESGVKASGFSGVGDLRKIPMVDRPTLEADQDSFLLQATRELIQRRGSARQLTRVAVDILLRGSPRTDRELAHDYRIVAFLETAGTTGEALPISLTRRDLGTMATQGARALQVAGVGGDDTIIDLLEPAPSGGFWCFWLGAIAAGIPHVAPGNAEPRRAAEIAIRTKATVMVARTKDALRVLGEGAGEGLRHLRRIVLAPEPVRPRLLERLKEAAGSRVALTRTYGFAEGRTVWAECAEGAGSSDCGYHLSPDLDLVETISTRPGTSVGPGEPGEIVFTGLDQRGTALARYRPGDYAVGGVVPGRCPYCGRAVDRIIPPIIRTQNLIELRQEGSVHLAIDSDSLRGALVRRDVSGWQVEISREDGDALAPDEVFVFFSPRKGRDPARVAVALDRTLRTEAGLVATQLIVSDRAEKQIVDVRGDDDLG